MKKMTEIKIKNVGIESYTSMISTINTILAFIICAILFVFMIAVSGFSLVSIFTIVILLIGLPLLSFLVSLALNFLRVKFYNLFSGKLNPISFELYDGEEILKIQTLKSALILACVAGVVAFILGIVFLTLSPFMQSLYYILPFDWMYLLITQYSSIGNILLYPIITFVSTLIGFIIYFGLYNIFAPLLGGVKVDLEEKSAGNYILNKVKPISLALNVAIISLIITVVVTIVLGIIGFVMGAVAIVAFLVTLAIYAIMVFVFSFVAAFIIVALYNFFAPKIGAVELELE